MRMGDEAKRVNDRLQRVGLIRTVDLIRWDCGLKAEGPSIVLNSLHFSVVIWTTRDRD